MVLVHDWICRKLVGLLGEGRGGGNDDLLLLSIIMLQLRSRKRADKTGRWEWGGGKIRKGFMTYTSERGGEVPLWKKIFLQ